MAEGAEEPQYLMMLIGTSLMLSGYAAAAALAHIFQPTHCLQRLRELTLCMKRDAGISGMHPCCHRRTFTYVHHVQGCSQIHLQSNLATIEQSSLGNEAMLLRSLQFQIGRILWEICFVNRR